MASCGIVRPRLSPSLPRMSRSFDGSGGDSGRPSGKAYACIPASAARASASSIPKDASILTRQWAALEARITF